MSDWDELERSLSDAVGGTMYNETVTYRPRSGTPRTVKAMVTRPVPAKVRMMPGYNQARLLIEVCNRSTAVADDGLGGIATSEINTGGDFVDVAVRVGGTPEKLRLIGEPVNQDAGSATYALY